MKLRATMCWILRPVTILSGATTVYLDGFDCQEDCSLLLAFPGLGVVRRPVNAHFGRHLLEEAHPSICLLCFFLERNLVYPSHKPISYQSGNIRPQLDFCVLRSHHLKRPLYASGRDAVHWHTMRVR